MKKNKKILFVGAFNKNTKDGSTGGQLFACTSLMESDLVKAFDFIQLDTTSETVPAPPVYKRFSKVFLRLFKIISYLFYKRIDTILIFSSAKLSFIEKGLMAIIYRIARKNVVFAPRSGLSVNDYENSKFMKWYMPKVIKKSNYVICQGETWKSFYQNISKEKDEKFVIINNWIDFDYYHSRTKEKNLSNSLIKIIYIGQLYDYKGVKDLLEALLIVKKQNQNFLCEIYGKGTLFDFSEQFIKENGLQQQVKLMGWASHEMKIQAFCESNIYVLPSHSEGFPNSLLEAMAAEMAVVATKVGAVEDIVSNNENGILINSKQPIELANGILELLNNEELRNKLARNACKTVQERFTIDVAKEKFKKIL